MGRTKPKRVKSRRPRQRVRLLQRHERDLYTQAVDLLRGADLTRSTDPFGLLDAENPELARLAKPRVFVALERNRVVGVAGTFARPDWIMLLRSSGDAEGARRAKTRTFLTKLVVAPTQRGQGIGSALVDRCVEQAQRDGFSMLAGFAEGDRDALNRFYSHHGMRLAAGEEGLPPEIYGLHFPSEYVPRVGDFFWKNL